MKAIETKYIGPSNLRGSRIKAVAEGGNSITLSYDSALNSEENHDRAALALAEKKNWLDPNRTGRRYVLARGGLASGRGNVYVFVDKYSIVRPSKKTETKRSR